MNLQEEVKYLYYTKKLPKSKIALILNCQLYQVNRILGRTTRKDYSNSSSSVNDFQHGVKRHITLDEGKVYVHIYANDYDTIDLIVSLYKMTSKNFGDVATKVRLAYKFQTTYKQISRIINKHYRYPEGD